MNNNNINNLINTVRNQEMKDIDMPSALDIINGSTTQELCEASNGLHQDFFYKLLTKLWPWKDVIDFYNIYSNMDLKEKREVNAGKTDQLKKDLVMAENAKIELENTLSETRNKYLEIIGRMEAEYSKERIYKDGVIYKLKARLYDIEHENDQTGL